MSPPHAAADRMADVEVDGRADPGAVTVPADLLGLSVEWSMVEPWFGTSATSTVAATTALLQTLQRDRTTAGVLRVGGNSQDGYLWDPDGSTADNTLFTGTITSGMVDALLEVARRSGWRLLLGVDLRADDPARAAAMARYVTSADPDGRLLALEIGNEPNAYFGVDIDAYVARFTAYAQAIAEAVPDGRARLAGPAISHAADLDYLRALRAADPPGLALTTWHHYANQPTRGALLSTATTDAWTRRVREASEAAGGPARMAEGNSVGTGGLDGVSNVLTSASWLVETVLSGAAAGLAGFCLHSWDGWLSPAEGRTCWYTPFVVRGGAASARPPYYGLALLRYALGRTFRATATSVRAGDAVSSWALVDPGGRIYVYLVERAGTGHGGTVRVTVPAGLAGPAYLSRLGDAGGCAGKTTGINGSHLAADGTFSWPARTVRPVAGSSTQYDLALGPCETLLLSVGPR